MGIIFIRVIDNSPGRLWVQVTSQGGGRPTSSAFMESLEVLAHLLSFCAAFSKSTISFLLESPNGAPFVGLESRLDKLSNHV